MNLIKNLSLLVVSSLVAFIVLELSLYLLIESDYLEINKPSYSLTNASSMFWVDIDTTFGVWHASNSSYRHVKSCFDVIYEANSYGARDVERTLQAEGKRVIMLGDSFTEGYAVNREKRLTDLLEHATGIEHLNFGVGGDFGPIQYYLLYKTLAKKFEHHAVMVGILPGNDFWDMNYKFGREVHRDRYRPYLVGRYPDYRLIYSKEELKPQRNKLGNLRGILREFTHTYNSLVYLKKQLLMKERVEDSENGKNNSKFDTPSGYYDFTPKQFNLLKYVIERIIEEAEGKEIYIYTIPCQTDFERYTIDKAPPLSKRLEEFCEGNGVEYLDLLPYMYEHTEDWGQYFHPCDPHWNEYGNLAACEILRVNLPIYQRWLPSQSIGPEI